jgi:MoaA/NifB/PqqE/SkfB family radical SAM enzyme
MSNFHSIDTSGPEVFLISWDMGRRCNYDCSYCPPHRHDNTSPHASLEELQASADFVFKYAELITQYRTSKDVCISFTGGEPTVNPVFIKFSKYLKSQYELRYKEKFKLILDLTTNGAMSKRTAQEVANLYDHVTVSYHTEANSKLKDQSLVRTEELAASGIAIKVNVMLHAVHFEECKTVMERLKSKNIKFIPRAIGEEPNSKFAHKYTQEQIDWFQTFWGRSSQDTLTGRPCCGGRSFKTCGDSGTEEVKFINFRKFKDWHCSVNWFFLHIEQQTDLVYHHQTCQARLDGTRGSIGKISESNAILETLKNHLEQKTMPIIVCPNQFCGCGLCTPKSNDRNKLIDILPTTISDMSIFS